MCLDSCTLFRQSTVAEASLLLFNDLSRIDEDTRVIAINVPNVQGVQGSSKNKKRWYDYVTTVDEIERLTGLDFFTSLPDSIEDELEGRIDRSTKTKSIL